MAASGWSGGAKASRVNERTPVIDVGRRLRKSFSVLNHTRTLFRNSRQTLVFVFFRQVFIFIAVMEKKLYWKNKETKKWKCGQHHRRWVAASEFSWLCSAALPPWSQASLWWVAPSPPPGVRRMVTWLLLHQFFYLEAVIAWCQLSAKPIET